MSAPRWQSIVIDEVEPIAAAGVSWRPLRRALDVRAFGINAYSATAAGDHVVEPHTEEALGHEEVYVVLLGRATFTLDGETLSAPAGTVVHVRDPAVRREAHADVPGTTVLAVGAAPGRPYAPSAWEAFFAVERFRAAGDHRAAIAELEAADRDHPDNAGIAYALACWHALAGDDDEALALARRASALDQRFGAWALQDEDLASIRDRLP